jgi:hypothetical protein
LVSTDRQLDAVGPSTVDLQDALPAGRTLKHVVYMIPHDAPRFIDPSCAPTMRALQIGPGQILVVIPVTEDHRVLVVDQRLYCTSAEPR